VFKSSNGGSSWSTSDIGLTPSTIKVLTIDPANSQVIYAGDGHGVLKSTDGGNTWNAIKNELVNAGVNALAIDPINSLILYVGTDGGVFKGISTLPPDVTIDSKPAAVINTPTATFSFSSTDATAIFECKLDFGTFSVCATPYTIAPLVDGTHDLQVRAKNLTGDVTITPASYSWIIDTTPPDTSILAVPTSPTANATFTSVFTSTELNSTFECQLDESSFNVCTSGINYIGLAVGSHTFNVRAIDQAGNTDPTPATYTWTINPAFVKIGNNSYATLTDALFIAVNGDKLKLLNSITPEAMTYVGSGMLTLEGGYDAAWIKQPDLFSVVSSLTVTSGTLIVDQVMVK